MTPTARTLKRARELGFTAGVVERFNSFTKTRHDLFGCIDIIAIHPQVGIVGIQACAGASHAARADKMKAEPRLSEWLAAGGKAEVWSWRKSDKSRRWELRRESIAANDTPAFAGSAA